MTTEMSDVEHEKIDSDVRKEAIRVDEILNGNNPQETCSV